VPKVSAGYNLSLFLSFQKNPLNLCLWNRVSAKSVANFFLAQPTQTTHFNILLRLLLTDQFCSHKILPILTHVSELKNYVQFCALFCTKTNHFFPFLFIFSAFFNFFLQKPVIFCVFLTFFKPPPPFSAQKQASPKTPHTKKQKSLFTS